MFILRAAPGSVEMREACAVKATFHNDELGGDSTVLEPDLTIVHKARRLLEIVATVPLSCWLEGRVCRLRLLVGDVKCRVVATSQNFVQTSLGEARSQSALFLHD